MASSDLQMDSADSGHAIRCPSCLLFAVFVSGILATAGANECRADDVYRAQKATGRHPFCAPMRAARDMPDTQRQQPVLVSLEVHCDVVPFPEFDDRNLDAGGVSTRVLEAATLNMKILDAGDHSLSNADVLDWIKRKRSQHETEDAEELAANVKGAKPTPRPKNFITALIRHERELTSPRYPYTKNFGAYAGDARNKQFKNFCQDSENAIQDSLEAEWKDRLDSMTKEQIDRDFAVEQDKKCLTEPELLMLYNHAPVHTELLQPMIENVEERFSAEEQALLIDVIWRTLRVNEQRLVEAN
ncbi:hypothetical protein DOTSEDRAFT_78463 [Dothistroma septosporum NZE10]|uniref:Secreted protein n=1 Tax=Dothistroma septosporum (strain NZE10 / CBS 128990) TaxID=675120 RepID=N1PUL6_DOTSN|nr:hypothetical protein DOTSEDRAFT_78463 [Dothistroma septosporum NZE10]